MKRKAFWGLDLAYWILIAYSALFILGCVFCALYPNSALARDRDGSPGQPSVFLVATVPLALSVCCSVWGLRLNTRRRKAMDDDYRRSLQ